MIQLKSEEQIKAMKLAGRITAEALILGGEAIKPGVTTKHIDDIIRTHIEKCGARPSFLGYAGFPGSACISINSQVIHGIPSKDAVIEEGDIVSIDTGAFINGFHGDSARTFACGKISAEAAKLIEVTKECFFKGFEKAVIGNRLGDIGSAVQSHAESFGYGVVREYVGHGVGHEMHESPDVPNYGREGRGLRLMKGLVIAIEPMINAGTEKVRVLSDGWTVVSADGKPSAHYENTVAITENGPEILTRAD